MSDSPHYINAIRSFQSGNISSGFKSLFGNTGSYGDDCLFFDLYKDILPTLTPLGAFRYLQATEKEFREGFDAIKKALDQADLPD